MKKLFLAMSVFTLTIFTSCTNDSNESITVQEKPINKTMSKGDDGSISEDERIAQADAILFVKETMAGKGITDTGRRPPEINCHTAFNTYSGHACVFSGGYLFLVSWEYDEFNLNNGEIYAYTAVSVHSCHC